MKRAALLFGATLSLVVLVSAMKSAPRNVDLTSKGIPIIVDAPSGSVVRSGLMDGMEMENVKTLNWEINKDEFSLDVSMEDADLTQSKKEFLRYAKSVVEMDPSFVEYVDWNENGFLVKLSFNGAIEYDFYHLIIKDNRAIEFSVGLGATDYSLANIWSIYKVARTAR